MATIKTNIWGIKAGDTISFTNSSNCFISHTISRVEEKSWYTAKGNRNSWGTLESYSKYPDFKITKANVKAD